MNVKSTLNKLFFVSLLICTLAMFSNNDVSAKSIQRRPITVHIIQTKHKAHKVMMSRRYHKRNKKQHFRVISNRNRVNRKLPRLHYVTGFPDRFKGGRFPQSISLDKHEHNLYLGFDSYYSDGSKVIRYNLHSHHFHAGPTFRGGHAQGVSLNRNSDELWFLNKDNNNDGDDHAGISHHGRFVEVSTKTLKPIYSKPYNLKRGFFFNNTLTFSNRGAFISVDTKHHSKKHPKSFVFYHVPALNLHHNAWFRLRTIIRHVPYSATLECLAYNPRLKRLYIESETPNNIWSLPINKLLNSTLKYRDINEARIPIKQEPEGMAFTNRGYAYLMFGGSNPWNASIYRTTRPITF